ncbi:hypothetical protein [Pacificibacter marinus]|uniref:hypothetical protein n=1 Tax=Pacificibacter marinus TaxID=658057 RepID=UPI001C073888|nr:hypothetical protein [Pacificibacter marinus]MBU2866099.1 hypothetical protein [Pacificibacter marinus]
MKNAHKSATCCYCGTHTVLTLAGKTRHELQCTSCGAPLRRMKSLRTDHVIDPFTVQGTHKAKPKRSKEKSKDRNKSRKRKKSIAYRLMDVAEDIFDIFD